MADDEQPADVVRRMADDVEQGGSRGEVEALVIAGSDRAIAGADLLQGLDHPPGGRGEDQVEGEPLRLHLGADGRAPRGGRAG